MSESQAPCGPRSEQDYFRQLTQNRDFTQNPSFRCTAAFLYAAFFFSALNLAQRARVAAAILFLPAAEIVRLPFRGAKGVVLAVASPEPFRAFAHLAFCASAILRREAAEMIRFGWLVLRDVTEPFNDSITVIA
jgi:hypothetical protein